MNYDNVIYNYTLHVHNSLVCKTQDLSGTCLSCSVLLLSHVRLFETPWTVARQAPLSMGFPRQEHWSGLPFPSPRDLPHPGIELESPSLQVNLSDLLQVTHLFGQESQSHKGSSLHPCMGHQSTVLKQIESHYFSRKKKIIYSGSAENCNTGYATTVSHRQAQ